MNSTPADPVSAIRRRLASLPIASAAWIVDRGAIAIVFVMTVAVLLLAALTRALLVHQPLYDELLHVFAARGLLATGQPVIQDGIYERAELYTITVKWAMQWFGDTLVAARLPAWISALALAAVTGAWTTRRIGVLAGLASAAFFAVNPITIDYSVFARFYTMHALFVTVTFIALYESFARDRRPQVRAMFVLIAALAMAVAWHLQITTLIAISAAGAGIVAVLVLDHGPAVRKVIRARPLLSAGILVGALIAIVAAAVSGGLLERFGSAPLWAARRATSLEYYNALLARDMPLLWPLFPIAAVATFLVDRRLAVFCTVTALVALAIHSLAAQKDARYIYYVIPILCVVWGCAAAKLLEVLPAFLERSLPMLGRAGAPLLTLAFVVFLGANSSEGRGAVRLLLGRDTAAEALSYASEPDWSRAVPALVAARAHARATVTSNSMKAIHYLGNYDIELNASIVPETETGEEFGLDPRTGRAVISTADSMAQLLRARAPLLVIVERKKLGIPAGVPVEVVELLEHSCTAIPLADSIGIVAWLCEESGAGAETALSAGEALTHEPPPAHGSR